MALIDQYCLDDERYGRGAFSSEEDAGGFQRNNSIRSIRPYVRHQVMLGQMFEFEVTDFDVPSKKEGHTIKNDSRRYKVAGLIIRAMMIVPVILAGLTAASLALTWYFLIQGAVVWGVAASGASIIFGSLFVVGIKLFTELRGATHGFKSINFRD